MKNYIEVFNYLYKELEDQSNENEPQKEKRDDGSIEELSIDDVLNEAYAQAEQGKEYFQIMEQNKELALLRMVNTLPLGSLRTLLEDILLEKQEDFFELFPATHWGNSAEMAFDWLLDLPHDSASRISQQMDGIFEDALNKKFGEKSKKVIDHIVSISAYSKVGIGLSKKYIRNIIKEKKLSKKVKLDLLIILSQMDERVDATFWQTKVNLTKEPFLAPAVLSAFTKGNPYRGLTYVYSKLDLKGYVYSSLKEKDIFETYTNWAIYEFLKSEDSESIKQFIEFQETIKLSWVVEMIDVILSTEKFARIRPYLKKNKKEDRYAIPESVLKGSPVMLENHKLFRRSENRIHAIKLGAEYQKTLVLN